MIRVLPSTNKAREKARKLAYLTSQNVDINDESKRSELETEYKDNENDIEIVNDGTAIFWNTKVFKRIENDSTHETQIITKRDNNLELTAIALPLKHLSSNKEFLVVTTHLKSTKTPAGEMHRKQQIELLFDKKNRNGKNYVKNNGNLPLLLCFDMNANYKVQ